jgi:hypothetical protein
VTSAIRELRKLFRRNGYARVVSLKKRKKLTSRKYKKGYEVRFVLVDEGELERTRRLLGDAGFKPGKEFPKNKRLVVPVYGKTAVQTFAPRRLKAVRR